MNMEQTPMRKEREANIEKLIAFRTVHRIGSSAQ
jgi:hypothetical protein